MSKLIKNIQVTQNKNPQHSFSKTDFRQVVHYIGECSSPPNSYFGFTITSIQHQTLCCSDCSSRSGDVYLFGGCDNSHCLIYNTLYHYSPFHKRFTEIKPTSKYIPTARYGCQIIYRNTSNELIIFGGVRRNFGYTNDLISFDLETRCYKKLKFTNPPAKYDGHRVFYHPSKDSLFSFGGFDHTLDNDSDEILKCSFGEKKWSLVKQVNRIERRSNHSLNFIEDSNKVVVFGGYGEKVYNDLCMYDIEERKWEKIDAKGDIPGSRYCHSSVIYGDKFFICGGKSDFMKFDESYSVYMFNFVNGYWSKIKLGELQFPKISQNCIGVVLRDNKLNLFSFAGIEKSNTENSKRIECTNKIYEINVRHNWFILDNCKLEKCVEVFTDCTIKTLR